MRGVLRLLVMGWVFRVKTLTRSAFFMLTSVFQPVIFSSIAYFMFRSGGEAQSLTYAALGAGLMGIWSSTLFGSGGAISWERWEGTLEGLVAAPASFIWVLLSLTIATATVGAYSIGSTLLWGWLFFDIPLEVAHLGWFLVSVPATVLALGMLGLVLATTFILYRHANAMSNLLEYPVWLVSGLLVPLSFLPGWTRPIAWVLAPTWGVETMRRAALGGDPLGPFLMTVALGLCYLLIGAITVRFFETLATDRAALSLA